MLFYLPCFFWGQSLIFVQLSSTTFCIEIYTHFSGLFLHISHNNITMQHLTIRKFIFWLLTNQFSCSIMSDSLWPHVLQYARPPCPSPTPRAYSHSCPSSWWCHPIFSSSFSSSPSPPAFNLSQQQGLCKWLSSLHQVAKVMGFQLQHQSFQWIFRTDFL